MITSISIFIGLIFLVQTNFEITREVIAKESHPGFYLSSSTGENTSFIKRTVPNQNYFSSLDVSPLSLSIIEGGSKYNPPFIVSDLNGVGYLSILRYSRDRWIYSVQYSDDDTYQIYYQRIWLQYNSRDFFLDSIHNADKNIHSSFSSDGKLLLLNTLNTLGDYYNPAQDDQIYVYDLTNLENEEIKKSTIPCIHCSDSYLIGNQHFFTIGNDDGYGGFANKDIYVAPWGKLEDSLKIASTTSMLAVSPDGKYILGTRFFDRYKATAVIIDVEKKKYQMLLGRDYAEYRAFYSTQEKKFSFQIKNYIVYIDFPKEYPFDALKWRNEEIPDFTEEEFWSQYEHGPLPD